MINLVAGTAQFGMDYGVTNVRGKIPLDETTKILDLLLLNNVIRLDTASSYGDAEEIIGKYPRRDEFLVTTKISCMSNLSLKEQVVSSLSKMNIENLGAVLIHDFEVVDNRFRKKLYEDIYELKEKKYFEKIGISIYSNKTSKFIKNNELFDIVQVPINIFNQEFKHEILRLYGCGVGLQFRSIFLQGVALQDCLPVELGFAREDFYKFKKYSIEKSISALDMCVGFIKSLSVDADVIFAVDNINQVSDVVCSFNKHHQDIDYSLFESKNKKFINPSLWS